MPAVEMNAARLAADGAVLHSIAQTAWQAARACQSALSGTGGMAGDEESAEVFAQGQDGEPGYDGYAKDVLRGVINAANTLKTLDAALGNTARAYDGAQLVGAFRAASESRIPEETVTPFSTSVTVPTALGPGPQTPLGEFGEFLQDALATIGVRLPDADTSKLGSAQAAWTELAGSMTRVQGRIDGAFTNTSSMTFPQKSSVLICQTKMSDAFGNLSESATSMAGFAQSMIDETNKAWEEIGWFIAQMAVEIALEIGVGVLLGAITFGAGAAAMAAKIAFTVMRWAIKIANLCKKLRTLIMAALRAARAAIRVGIHAAKEALSAGIASAITTVSFNQVRGALDPAYQPQNVLTAALAATAGGATGGVFSRVGATGTSRVTSTALRRTTHLGVEVGAGALDGLVSAAAESRLNGTEFNPLSAVVLGSLLGGAMSGRAPGVRPTPTGGGNGGGAVAPSLAGIPGATPAGNGSTPGGAAGPVSVSVEAPTPTAGGGGATAAGDGSGVSVSNDAPTPGSGGDGGAGAGDGTSVDVSSSTPDLPASLGGDGPGSASPDVPSVDAPSVDAPSSPAGETPSTPAADAPSTPAADSPGAPGADGHGTPAGDAPSTPAADAPSTPAGDAPTAPSSDAPSTPAADAPSAPASDAPSTPAGDAPSTPAADAPSAPSSDAPSTPSADAPSAPAGDAPTAPSSDAPSAPAGDAPGAPAADAPAAPAADAPATPAAEAPGAPAAEAPSAPPVDAPAAPAADAPSAPDAGAVPVGGVPGAASPSAPAADAPAAPDAPSPDAPAQDAPTQDAPAQDGADPDAPAQEAGGDGEGSPIEPEQAAAAAASAAAAGGAAFVKPFVRTPTGSSLFASQPSPAPAPDAGGARPDAPGSSPDGAPAADGTTGDAPAADAPTSAERASDGSDGPGATFNGYEIPELTPEVRQQLDALAAEPDSPIVRNDDGSFRLEDPIEVDPFEMSNTNHDWDEFTRQVGLQQQGLNDLSVAEWRHNTDFYDAHNRVGKTEQAAARDALAAAGVDVDGRHILHGPDQVAGGRADRFDGVGHGGVNSSLGNQWRPRRGDLGIMVDFAVDGISPNLLPHIRLNVELGAVNALDGGRVAPQSALTSAQPVTAPDSPASLGDGAGTGPAPAHADVPASPVEAAPEPSPDGQGTPAVPDAADAGDAADASQTSTASNVNGNGASARAIDIAQTHARELFETLSPQNRAILAANPVEIDVIPRGTRLTELAEYADLAGKKTFDGREWSEVRGIKTVVDGRTRIAIGEETLIPGLTAYGPGFVAAHEGGHAVQEALTPAQATRLQELYAQRTAAAPVAPDGTAGGSGHPSWLDPDWYSAANKEEYFANCIAAYQRHPYSADPAVQVKYTPEWLQTHDPRMYALLEEIYGNGGLS